MPRIQLKPPHIITATYRIVTPMFIGDAEQQASGISPASVKGALRFWWRALAWGRCWRENNENELDALKALHEEEARLFGSSMDEKKEKSGQGCFLLSVEPLPNLQTTDAGYIHKKFKDCKTARYLAYGLMGAFGKDAGKLERSCLDENQQFIVKLVFRNEPDESVIDALKVLGLLGGLGGRSRHGMGGIALEKMTHKKADADEVQIFHAPADATAYREVVQALLQSKNLASFPLFTAFSRFSKIEELVKGKTPYDVLDSFAEKMLVYRSWGQGGKISNGKDKTKFLDSDKKFQDDHDWYKGTNPELPEDFHPRRVVFGLPHNYHKKTHHVYPKPDANSNGEGRRASPLLFHVHRIHDTSFIGVATYLPATFLPSNKQIRANDRDVPQNIEWSVITDFLDGNESKKYFLNKIIIVSGDNI